MPLAHVVLVGAVPDAPGPWPATDLARGHLTVQTRAPDCAWPVAQRAGSAATGGTTFESAGAASCYEGSDLDVPYGAAGVPATVSGSVTLLGTGDPLTNRELGLEGNAALATGTLGRDATLVWWIPSPRLLRDADAEPRRLHGTGGAPSLTDLVPPWVPWAAVQSADRRAGAGVRPRPAARAGGRRAAAGHRPGRRDHRGAVPAVPPQRGPDPGRRPARPRGPRPARRALGLPRGLTRAELAGVSPTAPGGPRRRCAPSSTVPLPPTTPRWCGSRTTSTPSRGRYADRDRHLPGPGGRVRPQDPRAALLALRAEVAKAVVGQDAAVTGLVIALLCRGHVLLEGVPGVAKTLLVRTLAAALALDTKRVQFTPDLMPGDVTGSLVYDARTAEFSFREGPVFTNLLLADEINRTPPKTQAVAARGDGGAAGHGRRRRRGRCPTRSSSSRRRTRSSTRAPTRCPRPSSTGSCSS